jgi:hypothetical protein
VTFHASMVSMGFPPIKYSSCLNSSVRGGKGHGKHGSMEALPCASPTRRAGPLPESAPRPWAGDRSICSAAIASPASLRGAITRGCYRCSTAVTSSSYNAIGPSLKPNAVPSRRRPVDLGRVVLA